LIVALEEAGLHENTLFVLISDNGYFFGEHGLSLERRLPYEESIRSPLLISHPAAIGAALRIDRFALSIDIAPTLLAAAGAETPRRMQGRSLLPLLRGVHPPWRDSFLVEYYSHENPFNWTANLSYRAVRMGQYKYVRWIRQESEQEFYDLVADPYERRNIAGDLSHRAAFARARTAMERLVLEALGFRN
jgi:N-acetylglucosamine-6-sulfatase